MAAALVGGAFLSGAVQLLFAKLAPDGTIWDLFKTPNSNCKKLLRKLKISLIFVDKVLDDAEKKEITDRKVKLWLDELKDVFYDADDLLLEIVYDSQATAGDSASANAEVEAKFQEKLEEILERLAELKEEKDVLGLKDGGREVEVYGRNLPPERRTTSLVEESEVHGREADKEAITSLLMSEETNGTDGFGVIAIVGMGGLGKTTLAQLVYGQKEVSEKFQLNAWICVSEETDVFLVTRNILQGFAPEIGGLDSRTPDLLQTKLKDTLMGKRFLLVLDDVWDERPEWWKILLKPLKYGLQGSKIIVTTRSYDVASLATTVPNSYSLEKLSDDECWLVFKRCAFRDEDSTAYPDLEAIGRKMAAKCGGLPLAANALGSLLSGNRDETEWERIMRSEIWNLADRSILPALRLSYHYLSSSLKRCFAYCSLFPKDYEFKIDELVRLWMAEGIFASHEVNKPIEEIGADCFGALLSRSFFQKSSVNSLCFVMHDLIHDLAKHVAGDFSCLLEKDNAPLPPKKTRHLSYLSASYSTSQMFRGIYPSMSLRSFFPILAPIEYDEVRYMGMDTLKHLFQASKYLRILSLSGYFNIKEIPESIGTLKLLRYLDLSRTSIRRLPEAICKLCNLETLLLEYCKNLEEVPDSIVDLKCLHFLNLAGTRIKKLPTSLCSLVKLCFLDISRTELQELPPNLCRLTRLEKLTDFFVGKGSSCSTIEELKELSMLKGGLRIWNLQNIVNAQVASGSNLKGKKHLRDLSLNWKRDDADDSHQELKVLEGLEPPCTLENLAVRGYRSTKFPDWVGSRLFSNLVSLRIEGCKNCYEMPPLGHVETLETLHISGCDRIVTIDSSFYGSPLPRTDKPPFKSLEVLHFEDMPEWVTWVKHDGAFPGLKDLRLSECPKLENALPDDLPSLKKLHINGCDLLVAPFPRAQAIVELEFNEKNCTVRLNEGSGLRLSGMNSSSIDQMLGDIQQTLGASIADLKRVSIDRSDLGSGYEGAESCIPLEGVLEHFKCLDVLRIKECWNVVCFPKCQLAYPTLTKLRLEDLENLKSLPEQMKSFLPSLVQLSLGGCHELESFPEGGLPSRLESLEILACKKLMKGRKQWSLQALPSLSSLEVSGMGYSFDETESFPEAMLLPPTLTSLRMSELDGLKSLYYEGLQHLSSLQTFDIWNCNSLEKLQPELLPQSLTVLQVINLPNQGSTSIHTLTSLRKLAIWNCVEISLQGWRGLTSLEELCIRDCDNIESITTEEEALPSSLRDVELWRCPRLKSIQRGEGFPSSLERLRIIDCPLLAEKYQPEEGPEWHNIISYIPIVDIY